MREIIFLHFFINNQFNCIKRSEINNSIRFDIHNSKPDVLLLDTIGELSGVFSKIALTFIGGSLVPVGGHNIMEPAYFSKPIIFGPYMDNFPIAGEFLEKSAAVQAGDSKGIADKAIEILRDHERAALMGEKAKEIFVNNSGAVKKAVELVRSYIGTV